MRPAAPHSEEVNRFEGFGLSFLRRRNGAGRQPPGVWTARVLAGIRGVERVTLVHAALCGAVSGAIFGGTELVLLAWLGEDRGGSGVAGQWRYWTAYVGVALVVSAAEIAYLYWRVLLAVARMGELSGMPMGQDEAETMMALGLSRAALDLPNPRAPIHGVDPYARVPRWKLLLQAALYRVKVSATGMVVRVILRRLLGRAAVRSLIPFAAIGVYAVWNVVVTRWILHKARHRVAAPVAMADLDRLIQPPVAAMDIESRRLVAEAVAESITLSQDAHPNYVLFLDQVLDRLHLDPDMLDLDWPRCPDRIGALDADARQVLLRTVVATIVLNGRPHKAQRRLLEDIAGRCARRLDPEALRHLRRGFANGQGLDAAALDAVTPALHAPVFG